MNTPLQVLSVGGHAPDLLTSGFGPFVIDECQTLEQAAERIRTQAVDAVLIDVPRCGGIDQVLQWTALPSASLVCAVITVLHEPTWPECQRLLARGVHEIATPREAGGGALGRLLRLAMERKRHGDLVRRALSTDLATGLPHHAQLQEHMTQLLALREREPAAMSVIAVQLEGLRAAEAQYGHEAVNVLRRKVAVRLRANLRASDVVASLGADQFAVLLTWVDAESDGDRVADKLLQQLTAPIRVAGHSVALGARIGVSRYPSDGRDADALLRVASDRAAQHQGAGMGRQGVAAANG